MERRPGQPRPARSRPAPRGTASYQRKRAVTACQVCRARRTKCDNLKPSCSFCLKVGATCIQAPADLSSFDPASIQILERLDVLERLMRGQNPPEDEASPKHPAPIPPAPIPVSMTMVQPWTLDYIMAWDCFRDLFMPDEQIEDFCHPSSPQNCLDAQSPGAALTGTDLEPICVRELANNFFRYVHIKNPILDERDVRAILDSVTLNGIDWSPHSCLSLLVCALGAIATPFGPSHSTAAGSVAHAKAQSYFRAAERRIGTLISSYDIIAPQCFFLAGVFMMCSFEPVRAWRFFLQALAQCQQLQPKLPLPRAQQQYPDQDPPPLNSEFDSHQVVYWSAWKSEREMRRLLRMADFSLCDSTAKMYPAFFPTPPPPRDDACGPLGGAGQERSHDHEREQTAWYYYLAEISLRRLSARLEAEMETLREANCSSREAFLSAAASVVPSYETQMHAWVASLPHGLSFSAPAEEDDVCRFVLRGLAVGVMERIYWPFLSAFLDTDYGVLGSAWLAPYAGLAQKGLDHQKFKITVNMAGFRHRHHGTYPLVQSCSRASLVLCAAALIQARLSSSGSVTFLTMPQEWASDVREVLDMLEFWGEETRIFDGTRSVIQRAFSKVS